MAIKRLIGTAPSQVSRNADLGNMAFQNKEGVNIDRLQVNNEGATVTRLPGLSKIPMASAIDGKLPDEWLRSTNQPSVRPSLLLDFANSKTLDPKITFSRASTAKYYDGKTFTKAEENLLTYSQDFSNAVWTKVRMAVITNATTAPDGTLTAAEVVSSEVDSTNYVNYTAGSFTAGATYIVSVFLKKNAIKYVQFSIAGSLITSAFANFDLELGATGDFNGVTASIQSIGNGWYRCSVLMPTISATASTFLSIYAINSLTDIRGANYTGGALGNSFHIWGAQLEQSSVVGPYLPTTTSALTTYIPQLLTAPINAPIFDHDPVTGDCLGLRIEGAPVNSFLYSQDFENAYWDYNTAVVVKNNVAIAPDGTRTAAKITPTANIGNHKFGKALAGTNAVNRVYSFYVKSAGKRYINLNVANTVTYNVTFDLDLGTFITPTAGVVGLPTMLNVGNGWWRISFTTATLTAPALTFLDTYTTGNFSTTSTGDGYSGIYIWGAQWEDNTAVLSSYIPTNGATASRSADMASITGTNFSFNFNINQGTLYSEFNTYSTSDVGPCCILPTTGNNLLSITKYNNGVGYGGVYPATGLVPYSFAKAAITYYDLNLRKVSANGLLSQVINSAILLSTAVKLHIGAYYNDTSGPKLNGCIKKIAYYPKKLSDIELQAMTSN